MTHKPTVFILGKLPPPYMGPSVATQIILASGLKDSFHLIHIDTKLNSDLREMGVFHFNKIFSGIRLLKNYLKELRTKKPDLILIPISQSTFGFLKDAPFILIGSAFKTKSLLHLRGSEFRTWYENRNSVLRAFVRFTIRRSNGVIVLGQNLKYIFEGLIDEENIHVSPNGGNFPLPPKNIRKNDNIEILYIGNLQSSKGIEDLLTGLSLLSKTELEKIQLTVLGSWRDENTKLKCLELVRKYNLPVQFSGQEKSKDKYSLLSNADIFVFTPRLPEGHPWVIVEAMAAGLPIISTDRGAITESVENEVNGFIVPLRNPEAIAQKLSLLVNDPEKRKRMGELSRKKYLDKFTEEKMTENLSSLFRKTLNIKE